MITDVSSQGSNGIHMDNNHRRRSQDAVRPDGFDIDELIRRLEAHRLELKLAQVRERSRALQNAGSGTLTYKPRYSVSLKPSETTQSQTPSTDYRNDRSRRTTRTFTLERRTSTRDSSQGGSPTREGWKSKRSTRTFDYDRERANSTTPPSPPGKSDERQRRRTTRIYEDDEVPDVPERSNKRASRVISDIPAVSSEDFATPPPEREFVSKRSSVLDMVRPKTTDPALTWTLPAPQQAWVNPKQFLAARSQGMSESEAIHHLQDQNRRQEEEERIRQEWHRRSFKFLDGPPMEKKTAPKSSRMSSTPFDSMSLDNLRGFAASRKQSYQTLYEDPVRRQSNATPSRDDLKSRRKSWLRPERDDGSHDRPNWAQQSESCNADQRDRQRFLGRMKRVSRVFAENGKSGSAEVAPQRAAVRERQSSTKVLGPPSRESADSAIVMADGTEKSQVPKQEPQRRLGFRKSIANLFRRK